MPLLKPMGGMFLLEAMPPHMTPTMGFLSTDHQLLLHLSDCFGDSWAEGL